MSDPVGQLVEFIDKNRVILGLVQTAKKGRLGVLTSQDKQIALPAGRILLLTPGGISPEKPRQAIAEYLAAVDARREDLAAQVDVLALWELVHAEADPVPVEELTELQFGDAGPDHLSSVLRALFYERLHFRLAGNSFLPLTAEQLEQKVIQQEREEAHRAEVDAAVEYLRAAAKDPATAGEAPEGLLDTLKDLVVLEDDSPSAKKAKEIVSLAELGGRRQVFNLLVRLSCFSRHENLALIKEGLPREFPPAVLARAAALTPSASPDGDREDLTGLHTFTIDGQFTTDFDDALSFEPSPAGGGELGVHIADAASLIAIGDTLDQEARERGHTLYMPDDRIPMLPPTLSEDALSLREGQLRPAISCLAQVDAEGKVGAWRVVRSWLRVTKRLTYDEADLLLQEGEARLSGLQAACQALRRQRARAGAYFLPLPELIVGVDEEGEVWVRRIDRDGPSREMVAETAILANGLKARFLMEKDYPALYRTQAQPSEPIDEGDPGDIYHHFRQRRQLNRVELTPSPGLHSSLGVEPYTQATSPIRRYLDLVMQRQITSAVLGIEPTYSEEALMELATYVEPNLRRGFRVRQQRQRYWIMQWLRARRDQDHPALVMEKQARRWQLLLTDVMLLTTIPEEPGLRLEPGQEVMVRIDKVDPFFEVLRVKLA